MRPGCIVNIKFKTVNEEGGYGGYLSYMDRAEAVGDKEHGMTYEGYTDYMGNQEKSHGLFTENQDTLESIEKRKLQDVYKIAYERGSLLWQPIISFDNTWLEENHIYNSEKNIVDEAKLREATRNYMRTLIEKEKLGNAVWSAAIHYNTDNIHIHVGLVELTPTRNADGRQVNGKVMEKGLFKMKNIEQSKSRFVNTILDQKKENEIINTIMRETIIKGKKDVRLMEEEKFYEPFLHIYEKLPTDRRTWKYGMNAMKGLRPELDNLSKMYIENYHKDSFQELVVRIVQQQTAYARAYGTKNESGRYLQNKLEDLYQRLGNAILDELREFDKKMRYTSKEQNKSKEIVDAVSGKEPVGATLKVTDAGGKKDIKIAQLENISTQSSAEETYLLGKTYEQSGEYEKAFEYYLKSADASYVDGQYKAGKMYVEGKGCKKDVKKGIDLLKKSSDHGNVAATYSLGKAYEQKGDFEKAFKEYRKSADASYNWGQFKVGTMYINGMGCKKNVTEGVKWLEKSANNGNKYAEITLYRRGRVGSSVKNGVADLRKAMWQLQRSMKSEYETFRNVQEYDIDFDKAMRRQELDYEYNKH